MTPSHNSQTRSPNLSSLPSVQGKQVAPGTLDCTWKNRELHMKNPALSSQKSHFFAHCLMAPVQSLVFCCRLDPWSPCPRNPGSWGSLPSPQPAGPQLGCAKFSIILGWLLTDVDSGFWCWTYPSTASQFLNKADKIKILTLITVRHRLSGTARQLRQTLSPHPPTQPLLDTAEWKIRAGRRRNPIKLSHSPWRDLNDV